jgi:hypothetical protein
LLCWEKWLDWTILVSIPLVWLKIDTVSFDAIRLLNALIAMALAVVILRAISVGNGIISLLRLSAELAISEAQVRDEAKHLEVEKAINDMPKREGFGAYVDLPRH